MFINTPSKITRSPLFESTFIGEMEDLLKLMLRLDVASKRCIAYLSFLMYSSLPSTNKRISFTKRRYVRLILSFKITHFILPFFPDQ